MVFTISSVEQLLVKYMLQFNKFFEFDCMRATLVSGMQINKYTLTFSKGMLIYFYKKFKISF